MTETWQIIPSTEGLYEASSLGRIRSKDRVLTTRCKCGEVIRTWKSKGRVLKPWADGGGYLVVYICANDERRAFNVHRLVASAFHRDGGELVVNHVDGDKTNNRPENLEWVTWSENLSHAFASGLRQDSKPIVGLPVDGGEPIRFPSASAAARHFGIYGPSNITAAARGKWSTAYGYRWKYEELVA